MVMVRHQKKRPKIAKNELKKVAIRVSEKVWKRLKSEQIMVKCPNRL